MQSILGVPMSTIVVAVSVLFVGGLAALLAVGLRDRLLLRLALRNVPRRRAQSALIALGLALSTVIITTALNTGDTISHTLRSLVAGTVGRADEIVVRPRRDARRIGFDNVQSVANGTFLTGTLQPFEQAEADRLAAALADDDRIAGVTASTVEQVLAVNGSTGEVQAQVRLYALPRSYPPVFGTLTDTRGGPLDFAGLDAGAVVLNADAALALGAEPGHRLQAQLGEHSLELTVAAIARSGDLTGVQATIVMPLDDLQRLTEAPGQINQVLIANRGNSTTSVLLSQEVAARVRPLLVDPEAARRIHGLLRSEIARAELTAALPALDEKTQAQVQALLTELEASEPSPRFAAIISDPELERRLFALSGRLAAQQGRAGTSTLATLSTLRVLEVKRLSQELADRWGAALTTVFVVLGLFSIATGTMLVVLIFVMLAAERRTELGVMRALGARQGRVAATLLYEGLLYDLVAAAVGVVVGIAVAIGLISMSASVLAGFGITLTPRVEPVSLWLAYCLGAVVTMVSVAISAWRAGRLSIVSAIRNLPEPPRPPNSVRPLVVGVGILVLGVLLSVLSAGTRFALPSGAGVVLITLGVAALARPLLLRLSLEPHTADRLRYSVAGAFLLAYWLLPTDLLGLVGNVRPLPRSVDLFFVAGLTLVLGAVLILAHNLEIASGLARQIGDGMRGGALVVRLALAFPVQNRFRTGMTVAMFGLVIFSMVVAAVLLTGTHRAYSDPEIMAGGYDIRVDETAGGAPALQSLFGSTPTLRAEDYAAVGVLTGRPAEAIQPGSETTVWRSVGLNALDDQFTQTIRAGFSGRAAGYASDAAVWEALRTQPGTAIVAGAAARSREVEPAPIPTFRLAGAYREDAQFPPTTVWVRDTRGGKAIRLTVIGILDPRTTFGSGLFTSPATLAAAELPAANRTATYLRTAPGAVPAERTLALNVALAQHNLRASEIGEDVRRILGLRMLLNDMLQAFIGVGLLAGIAGLGVISMRAVVERRREIGMLRALGFTARAVQATFVLEATVVALLGIAVGIGLGLGLAERLIAFIAREFPEIVFTVPWGQIGGIALFAYVAALATTAWPAWRAGRVQPAQALRYD
ncbi:MAG: FtsX-like permease family protein [Chloroflexi bacterium]|nr:FtsX-like permease family protein [Chloroflexota bacterium]